ncbi:uncharacterized protein LOC111085833 isoform X2 [Limulus polyphemus]|uniref:Uncharacterized protein LOC111085833 isoform X2 n=1 Tax=Limulus polyphemus TaxID=6850 RepID=A0ABM1SE62_LIMPO|nr:uncharacterized protein LOC111085833 isoform X2 [Limulus polyphemus]
MYTNVKDHYTSKIICAPFQYGLSPVSKDPSYLTPVVDIKSSVSNGEEATWCDLDCKNFSTMCFKHNQTFSPSEIMYSLTDYSSSKNRHFQNEILDICCGSPLRSASLQGNDNQQKKERVYIKSNNSSNSCSCLGLLQKCPSTLNHQEVPTPLKACGKFATEEQKSRDVSQFSSNTQQNQEEKKKYLVKIKDDSDLPLTPSSSGHFSPSFMTLPYYFSSNPPTPEIISQLSVRSSVLKEESSPCICPSGSQCESQRSTFYTRDADPILTSANFTLQLDKVTALKEMKKKKQENESEQLSYSDADLTSSSVQCDNAFHEDYRSTDTSDETFWSPSQEFTPPELFTNHMTSLISTVHSISEDDVG